MALKNQSELQANVINVENISVFDEQTDFANNIADSTFNNLIIPITTVSESALLTNSATMPAGCVIQEITAVVTSQLDFDSALVGLNIGSASLGVTGGAVANIIKVDKVFTGSAQPKLVVGQGASTHGHVSAALGSNVTMSFAAGGGIGENGSNTFFPTATTIHAQISSSAADKFFTNGTGKIVVSIRYDKVI